MTSLEVRSQLVEALELDLIGPEPGGAHEAEEIPQSPSRWYLTGFLIPTDTPEAQASDETDTEEIGHSAENADDGAGPESGSANKKRLPSSMGLSFLLPKEATEITATVTWGDYRPSGNRSATEPPEAKSADNPTGHLPHNEHWKRTPRSESIVLKLTAKQKQPSKSVPNSSGLQLMVLSRSVKEIPEYEGVLPSGTKCVSVFLVNHRGVPSDSPPDTANAFQACLQIASQVAFVARPNLRDLSSKEWDERVNDLQYRDSFEYAVGHGAATQATVAESGDCHEIRTAWIPTAEVLRVVPAIMDGVEFRMDALATAPDSDSLRASLSGLADQYRAWIVVQRQVKFAKSERVEIAGEMLNNADVAANRIRQGIELLKDPLAFAAFQLANKVMDRSARQRKGVMEGKDPAKIVPAWRPFQLAFVLMNLPGLTDPNSQDREVVDLLFFPTGGGKTEAYLGLAAYTLILRRMRNPGYDGAGVSVVMRYTLRLLTLDQLGRAATLICALELERQQRVDLLGDWPFEIGLWVGQAATPNLMGKKGDGNANSARARTIAHKNNHAKPSPIPLEECPWCGKKFLPDCFQLVPHSDEPKDLRITCANGQCAFTRNNALPILTVDEPIYRRLPCFLIATVDKFAAMPWTGDVGKFFGRANRWDRDGFYGPCDPSSHGNPLSKGQLHPPELIIQDELHLISGPMGTMVGLYETALEELCCRGDGAKKIRPKIIASTATVRRANNQIRALFNRRLVDVFPPPGPDRRDSFFAQVVPASKVPARLYVGVAAQGRSPKLSLLRTFLAIMGCAQRCYEQGKKTPDNAADPYMTMLGYFNSLRELGGTRRIVEDEVFTKLMTYGGRKRIGEAQGSFAERKINQDVIELTSRVSTDQVAEAKRALAAPFSITPHVDVALATNMISVGLDITRLGLMVVCGQPKTSSEYIQATSRVGREDTKPGLVVTVLNIHKPRDRSHYERFGYFHETFYRHVEATSVTPFSPRALDRGLAGTVVSLARLGLAAMTPPAGASRIEAERLRLAFVADVLADRAASVIEDPVESKETSELVRRLVNDLFDLWSKLAKEMNDIGDQIQYQKEIGQAKRLLYEFLNPELKTVSRDFHRFRANRSMRDVEPSVNIWVKTLDITEEEAKS